MAAFYTFEDYSGARSDGPKSDNPFQDLIDDCNDDAFQIQARYNLHRTKRNSQQKEKLLSPDFPGVTVDEILAKLQNPSANPGYEDPRYNLVFWARPTEKIRNLIAEIQQRLLKFAPNTWILSPQNLHLTALEISHSSTEEEVNLLVSRLLPSAQEMADLTLGRRARLVRPMVSFDAQALALSFLPAAAAGEPKGGEKGDEGVEGDDGYTYHHLRRDLYERVEKAGVRVGSRYVIPSAHATIARFTTGRDFEGEDGGVDQGKVRGFVEEIERINSWLEEEWWGEEEGGFVVGEGVGLELRKGAIWYGAGGETVVIGKGF